MAHFYGSMTGARSERTCCGTKNSGIVAHIRGWGLGVKVLLEHDTETGEDTITVMQTGGSNGANVPVKQVRFTGKSEEPAKVKREYQPKTGQACSCRPGVERDNCSRCEATGMVIDFAAICAR